MTSTRIAERYFEALCNTDGEAASALFTEDGVIDDYFGDHHPGRDEIRAFISSRPQRTLQLLGPVYARGPRLTAYTRRGYEDGTSRTVRFIFTLDGGQIQHLCNTRVDMVPPQFLSDDEQPSFAPRPPDPAT